MNVSSRILPGPLWSGRSKAPTKGAIAAGGLGALCGVVAVVIGLRANADWESLVVGGVLGFALFERLYGTFVVTIDEEEDDPRDPYCL